MSPRGASAPHVPRLRDSLPLEWIFDPGHLSTGRVFLLWDRLLDSARTGPVYLRRPEIADLVQEQLEQVTADGWCTLDAYVIMPNHVHVLWASGFAPGFASQVKGPTALRANQLLGRSGPFWQEEYFDRIVRDGEEYRRIRR